VVVIKKYFGGSEEKTFRKMPSIVKVRVIEAKDLPVMVLTSLDAVGDNFSTGSGVVAR